MARTADDESTPQAAVRRLDHEPDEPAEAARQGSELGRHSWAQWLTHGTLSAGQRPRR